MVGAPIGGGLCAAAHVAHVCLNRAVPACICTNKLVLTDLAHKDYVRDCGLGPRPIDAVAVLRRGRGGAAAPPVF